MAEETPNEAGQAEKIQKQINQAGLGLKNKFTVLDVEPPGRQGAKTLE